MRRLLTPAVLLISILLWSCGDNHGGGHAHAPEAGAHEPGAEGPGLTLNDGQKWLMDDHTRAMFAAMVDRLENQHAESAAPQELGEMLEADLDALIQGCTMTGDAHAELHKFLEEFIPAIQGLASAGNADELREVEELLALYPRYFE